MEEFSEKINNLNPRERVLITSVVIVLFLAIWDAFLFAGQHKEWKAMDAQINLLKAKQVSSNALEKQLKIQIKQDPNEREKIKLNRLKSEVERLDKKLKERTIEFISPQQMVPVLKEIISKQTDLRLISLKTLGANSLVNVGKKDRVDETKTANVINKLTATVYRHSLEMSLRGEYFSVLLYLKKMEDLGWRFNWDLINLAMDEYPVSSIKIRISTLSMEEGWIGV